MKNICFTLLVLLIGNFSFGQSLYEEFSVNLQPTGWTQTSVSPNDVWAFTGGLDFGFSSVILDPDGNPGQYARIDMSTDPDTTSLITPARSIAGIPNPEFSFYYISQTNSTSFTPYNRLVVQYWTGGAWADVVVIDTLTTAGWTKYTYNATNYTYATDSVRFRFAAQEGGAAIGGTGTATFDQDLAIDNVLIGAQCNPSTGTDVQTACGSYTWIDGTTYTSSNNTATFTLSNAAGCDSVVTLNLTINNPSTGTDVQTACGSYTWIDGMTYTSSNNSATFTLTNAVGCDSVVTLDLTINNPSTGTDVQTACGSYTWIDGMTYTSSNNSATFTLTNAVGCDSVVTLDLTINNANTGTDVQTACGSYTWIDGMTYTSSNNSATFTLTNAAGCDSVVTLDLTINNANIGTDVQTACGSYTWIDGMTYTSSNNSATFTLTNAVGCDSVVTLDLTINNANTGTDVQTACGSYTWIDGMTYTSSNNSATFTLTNAAGCDSVVTLDLTINSPSTGTDVQTACGSYTWIDGMTYTSSNNSATFTLTNAVGCDSVVTLDLTINNVSDITTTVNSLTITATNTNATYQWLDCDNNYAVIAGENNQTFTATANGNYAVELTENGCVDTSACVSITSVNINKINNQDIKVLVYPNPTTEMVSVTLEEASDVQLTVTTIHGQVVYQQLYDGLLTTNLNLPAAAGIYLLTIKTEEGQRTIKLVKE